VANAWEPLVVMVPPPDSICPAAEITPIYSFTLQDVADSSAVPDLKVLVQPVDRTSIVASSGPPQFVPAAQLEQSR
jgi:hypothetical protein